VPEQRAIWGWARMNPSRGMSIQYIHRDDAEKVLVAARPRITGPTACSSSNIDRVPLRRNARVIIRAQAFFEPAIATLSA